MHHPLLAFLAWSSSGRTAMAARSLLPFTTSHLEPHLDGCRDGCSGHGACRAGHCHCAVGWTGAKCEMQDCSPACVHGWCNDGVCTCKEGWRGARCAQHACDDDCSGHGVCVAGGTCLCAAGWGGKACAIGLCRSDCSGHGKCTGRGCVCDSGYAGASCGRRACPGDEGGMACSGHGACYEGRCECHAPYIGVDCSRHATRTTREMTSQSLAAAALAIPHMPCAASARARSTRSFGDAVARPCGPNGECLSGSAACVCFVGWRGERCDAPVSRAIAIGFHALQLSPARDRADGERCWSASQAVCPKGCLSPHGTCDNGACVCRDGYHGASCTLRTTCQRGVRWPLGLPGGALSLVSCSGRGVCTLYGTCECFAGYAGLACERMTCPHGCHGRGMCQADGTCACEPGWGGYGCALRTCALLANCSSHGACHDGSCICDAGWRGVACETRTCAQSDCSGRGVCDGERGVCLCTHGWSGDDCAMPLQCPQDCSGRGACHLGTCFCAARAYGRSCELWLCPEWCSSHGRCDQYTGKCSCDPGFGGTDCAEPLCPHDCSGHGICSAGQCICRDGFGGEDCSLPACSVSCNPHGWCDSASGECVCAAGFYGRDCSRVACPRAHCGQHGVCQDGACVCWAGWAGVACEKRLACGGSCGGPMRGICRAGVDTLVVAAASPSSVAMASDSCDCMPGFAGPDCSLRTCRSDAGCSAHGYCDAARGECVCAVGWAGSSCATRLCPGACSHAGRCVDGHCECMAGRYGAACDLNTCDDSHCSGRGACIRGTCVCDAGFAGARCSAHACPGRPACFSLGKCIALLAPPEAAVNAGNAGTGAVGAGVRTGALAYRISSAVSMVGSIANPAPHVAARHPRSQARGVCECAQGREGAACERLACPQGLSARVAASAAVTAHQLAHCSGHGVCDGRYGVCICEPPWTGADCSMRMCAANCSSHGVCGTSGKCACAEGWGGPMCERPGCASLGKLECGGASRGWCDTRRRACVCMRGWGGSGCAIRELLRCPNCTAHGRCVARIGIGMTDGLVAADAAISTAGGSRCVCKAGWRGIDCAMPACPAGCSGHGSCGADGSCICDTGWSGAACESSKCANECDGHGNCLAVGVCACFPGFGGVDCSGSGCVDDCGETRGHGVCTEGSCRCADGWSGNDCSRPTCMGGCSARGVCLHGEDGARCVCWPGFSGKRCERGCLLGSASRRVARV